MPEHAGLGPVLAPTLAFAVLPIIVYAFYSLSYILHNRLPTLRVVAVFSMGFPALLALLQAFMPAAMHLPNSESRPF